MGGKTQGGWMGSTVKGKERAVLGVKPAASFPGKIPAHRTFLRMRKLLRNEYEGARLLLSEWKHQDLNSPLPLLPNLT
jgi:hypothetical protein